MAFCLQSSFRERSEIDGRYLNIDARGEREESILNWPWIHRECFSFFFDVAKPNKWQSESSFFMYSQKYTLYTVDGVD